MKYIAFAILGLVSSQSLQASDGALPSENNGGGSVSPQVVRPSVSVATAPQQSVMDGGSNTMSFFAWMMVAHNWPNQESAPKPTTSPSAPSSGDKRK